VDNRALTGGNLGGGRPVIIAVVIITVAITTGPGGQTAEGTTGVSNRPTRQRVRPLPKGETLYTPGASPARQAAERRSAKPLLFLHQLPTWVAPLVLVALLIAGLAIRGPGGAVALCGVAAVLGWLASLSWPRLSANARLGRIVAVAVVLAVAGYQASR
jgi:hypothetical protein